MGRFFGKEWDIAGQALIDILIGLALISISVSFAVILVFGGQKVLIDRDNAVTAKVLAKEGIEAARTIRDSEWSGLSDGEHGLTFSGGEWQFNGTSSDVTGVLTRKIIITSETGNTKRIESRITWRTDPQIEQKVELVTILTDWRNVPPGSGGDSGDSGGGGVSGNWQNPRTLGSIDLGPGNQATDVDVLNKIVYISAEASAESKPDFFVVDATDGENPFVVSSIDTGPSISAVDVSGNYAYVANRDGENQLQIIDISQPGNPIVISSLAFDGDGEGLSVFYSDGKAYVGTEKAKNGREFHIVDITNPNNPTLLGDLEIGGDVNSIHVSAGKAYLATPQSSEVTIVDVASPASPSVLGSYDAPGNSEDGKNVYLVRNRLYLGRDKGGGHSDHHEFHILDISDPLSVQSLGSVDLAVDLNDIRVRDNLVFLGTSDPNEEFQVWDISDPENLIKVSSFNFSQVATGVDYEDNLVYISVRSNDALRIITSTP